MPDGILWTFWGSRIGARNGALPLALRSQKIATREFIEHRDKTAEPLALLSVDTPRNRWRSFGPPP